jgi:hypothetical protein
VLAAAAETDTVALLVTEAVAVSVAVTDREPEVFNVAENV